MQNPSIQITLVASKQAFGVHVLVGLAVALLAHIIASVWLALPMTVVLARLVWRSRRGLLGQLHWVSQQQPAQWCWREEPSDSWRTVVLTCDYLGPWLIGLKLDGRRLWVWPDSCDAVSHRLLRRALVRLP